MSHHDHDAVDVPRGALVGAAGLIILTIAAAAVGRLGGVGIVRMAEAAPVDSVERRFEDRHDGAVVVRDAHSVVVDVLDPGTHGFVRGVLRGLVRERKLSHIGADMPFKLVRWSDGRLSLDDPATGRRIDLGAFGVDNVAAFVRLMESPSTVAKTTD